MYCSQSYHCENHSTACDCESLTQVVIIQLQRAPCGWSLTDNEWHAEHKFLNVFSPAAALPEAFFFFAGILYINYNFSSIKQHD